MTVVGLSEFTFGYAFLYEQTHANWGNLVAAPILPSLQQEHDAGWDAHLPLNGIDFYYQFKLSDYLYRGNANYIHDGTYPGPYYRLALHKKDVNRQHQRLRTLAQTSPHTYYVAPEFNSIDNFNSAFLQHQITQQSRMIPVSECDDINDSAQHYITFRHGQLGWIQHSERKVHETSFTGKDLPALYRTTQQAWRPINQEFAVQLFDKTIALVDRVLEVEKRGDQPVARPALLNFDARPRERREVLERTSEILSVLLGVTLVVVGTREPIIANQP
jgi:hypothetical protein